MLEERKAGKEDSEGCSGLSQAYPGLCWWFTVQVCLHEQSMWSDWGDDVEVQQPSVCVCVCVFVCVCAPHEIMFMMQAGSCPCEDYLKHLFNFYWVFVSFLYEMNKVYVLKTSAFGHFIYFVDLLDMDWNLYGASLHAKMWPVHSQKYSPHVSLLPAQTFSLLRASQVTELVNESRN